MDVDRKSVHPVYTTLEMTRIAWVPACILCSPSMRATVRNPIPRTLVNGSADNCRLDLGHCMFACWWLIALMSADRQTDKKTYRLTDRQTGRETYRQTDRQFDIQTVPFP